MDDFLYFLLMRLNEAGAPNLRRTFTVLKPLILLRITLYIVPITLITYFKLRNSICI